MEEYEIESCVRGYHVYKDVWTADIGELLVCERDQNNVEDRYAVSVKKDGNVVGHLPKKISRVCSIFLRRGGNIQCTVVARRRFIRLTSRRPRDSMLIVHCSHQFQW